MERCPAGAARVETRLSFTNQLVSFFTLGIYTPMEIVVTCADDRQQGSLPVVRSRDGSEVALISGEPFLIQLH